MSMLDIRLLSETYTVRYIEESDLEAVLTLCKGNPLYYKHCPPDASIEGIKADMTALPNGKGYEDKYFIGFYDGDTPIAVMDLIDGYPDANTAFIGFFMIAREYQGKGIGSAVIQDVCRYLSKDFTHIRLGYVSTNEQSKHFWLKNGFLPTGTKVRQELYEVTVLQKELQ